MGCTASWPWLPYSTGSRRAGEEEEEKDIGGCRLPSMASMGITNGYIPYVYSDYSHL